MSPTATAWQPLSDHRRNAMTISPLLTTNIAAMPCYSTSSAYSGVSGVRVCYRLCRRCWTARFSGCLLRSFVSNSRRKNNESRLRQENFTKSSACLIEKANWKDFFLREREREREIFIFQYSKMFLVFWVYDFLVLVSRNYFALLLVHAEFICYALCIIIIKIKLYLFSIHYINSVNGYLNKVPIE